ncbi:MAG: HD domain-containing phosphohydrolase [Desulfitobacteriaceae bacterium]
MTDSDLFKSVIYNMPQGYAYHKVLCNKVGEPEDYVFLQVNPEFENISGLDGRDIIGRRASEIFPSNKEEFDFITIYGNIAINGGSKEFIRFIKNTNCWYKVYIYSPEKGFFIMFFSEVLEENISDITERKQTELNLQKRLDYEQLLNKISFMAVNIDNIKKFQNDCLQFMGETLKVSRIYIFEYHQKTDTMSNTYEWVASGITAEKENLQVIPASAALWWTQMMKDNQIISFTDIEDIHDEGTKNILRPQKIKSLLVVPLFLDQTFHGFLGFDECKDYRVWPEEDINFLLSISRLITQVILRQRVKEDLQIERIQLRSLFDSINESIYVADMENYKILYVNKALQDNFSKELIGEICYKVLQAKDNPCEFCTNMIIKELNYQPYLWEYHNPVINRDYQIIDRMIRWSDGLNVRFELAIDITERKRAEEALMESERFLLESQKAAHIGSFAIDLKTQTWKGSPEMNEIFGIDETYPRKVKGWNAIIHPDWRKKCLYYYLKVEAEKLHYDLEYEIIRHNDGKKRWVHALADIEFDNQSNPVRLIGTFHDITNRKKAEEEILYLSYHDKLTGLYNRRFYEEEIKRLDTERNLPISIIIGDVNGLKLVNDAFGHDKGDELLQKAAAAIQSACRTDDIVARWGGDEFVILLPKTESEEVEEIINRIKKHYSNLSVNALSVSISFGSDTKRKADEEILKVLKSAEDYMYKHKIIENEGMRGNSINTIINTLHEKNRREEQHSKRVSEVCQKIGRAIGLSEIEVSKLKVVGLLHDIGKIAIEEGILNKPGKLTEQEWKKIKQHPDIGYRILSTSYDMLELADCILAHHERWDGTGYPKGLKGEAITRIARIIALADSYDAMTSERPYRNAMTEEEVIIEIRKNAGTQFDPEIARIFVEKVLVKRWD